MFDKLETKLDFSIKYCRIFNKACTLIPLNSTLNIPEFLDHHYRILNSPNSTKQTLSTAAQLQPARSPLAPLFMQTKSQHQTMVKTYKKKIISKLYKNRKKKNER